MPIKDLVTKLYPLNRDLVSDGFDEAMRVIRSHLPKAVEYTEETFAPGTQVWTWRVPEKYTIHEAYLETEAGERVIDVANHRLHVFSYSKPVDRWMTWEELEPHLHYAPKRPDAIPWRFTYYEREWGFCLSQRQYERLPRNVRYHAVIDTRFDTSPESGLRVGIARVHPKGGEAGAGEILVNTHVDHPSQANDDASGVAVAVEVMKRLTVDPLPAGGMSVRFLFCPEIIGSIAYLSHHEELLPQFNGGLFVEMTGNRSPIALQRSWQDNHLIDHIARYVLDRRGTEYRSGAFRQIVGNDEIVMNGPGVNIPTISLSRSFTTTEYEHFPEYHTSDDTPEIIDESMLIKMSDVVEEIIRIYASNYTPKRTFRGPLFLSGHGLWVDWRQLDKKLGTGQEDVPFLEIEQMMMRLDGKHTVFNIVEELNLDYWPVWRYINLYRDKGLVEMRPIPRVKIEG